MCIAVVVSADIEFEAAMYEILAKACEMRPRRIKNYMQGIPNQTFFYCYKSAQSSQDSGEEQASPRLTYIDRTPPSLLTSSAKSIESSIHLPSFPLKLAFNTPFSSRVSCACCGISISEK